MTRSERLEPVVQHADKKEQAALQAVATSQNKVAVEEEKLTQLRLYRQDYMNRQQEVTCSVIELQEFNRFLTQLDETIKRQVEVIRLYLAELDKKREIWQQTRVSSA